jgi:hypothetical protein
MRKQGVLVISSSLLSPDRHGPHIERQNYESLIFVLLSINVTFAFNYLLFVDMFRPHTAIVRCYSIGYYKCRLIINNKKLMLHLWTKEQILSVKRMQQNAKIQ